MSRASDGYVHWRCPLCQTTITQTLIWFSQDAPKCRDCKILMKPYYPGRDALKETKG